MRAYGRRRCACGACSIHVHHLHVKIIQNSIWRFMQLHLYISFAGENNQQHCFFTEFMLYFYNVSVIIDHHQDEGEKYLQN